VPHPFVKSIQKGKDSQHAVLKALGELRPHVEALKEAEMYIKQVFSIAMRDVAPYAFTTFPADVDRRNEMIHRSGRRRLAAFMDVLSNDRTKLASWEQYVFPPVCKDIQLGDILRKAGGKFDDPSAFRVVLTPSCDLVDSGGQERKVDNVLVSCCCSVKDGLNRTSFRNIKPKKLKDKLPSKVLSPGYFESVILFPCLEGLIPAMVADLRDLEFIPLKDIGISGTSFLRIASIDSPFRELVSWAYLQNACRPGVPDRDFNSWCEEIVSLLKEEKEEDRS
jgi:CTP synthase